MSNEHLTGYTRCVCGAITVFHGNGNGYSCASENRATYLPGLDLRKLRRYSKGDTFCCDHCVNRYGLDLCACGSGEPYWKCKGGFKECGEPSQILGGRYRVTSEGSWMARA